MEHRTLEEKRQNVYRLLEECDLARIKAVCHLIESGFFTLPPEEIKELLNRVQNMTPEEIQQLTESATLM